MAGARSDRSDSNLLAWALIVFGGLGLLSRLDDGTGWLWPAIAAAAFIAAYRSRRTYAFLVAGSILAGLSAGLLVEGVLGWAGGTLLCLGAGFALIDRVEPSESRWPIYPATALLALGALTWLLSSGIFSTVWFPLLLIVTGAWLLMKDNEGRWVEVPDDDGGGAGSRQA